MNMKKLVLLNLPYLLFVYPFDKVAQAFRLAPGADLSAKLLSIGDGSGSAGRHSRRAGPPGGGLHEGKEREEIPPRHRVRQRTLWCIILSVNNTYMDAGGYAHD